MTRLEIAAGRLEIEVLGWHKLWACKSHLDFPLEHVASVRGWNAELDKGWIGWRAPGTSFPGVITAGTYHPRGEHVFWDVHRKANALVIGLKDEWYNRLVVEVENPEATLRKIEAAIRPPQVLT